MGKSKAILISVNYEMYEVLKQISLILFQISQEKLNIEDPDFKLKIKISGDGAKMSRLTSFVVISFSVLNNEEDVMSSRGTESKSFKIKKYKRPVSRVMHHVNVLPFTEFNRLIIQIC